MPPAGEVLIVFCSCPDAVVASRLADALIDRGLAACASFVPGVHSTYRWKGALQHDEEVLLMIKTTDLVYPALEQAIAEMHPYELPEILGVPVRKGLPDYLAWVYTATTPGER